MMIADDIGNLTNVKKPIFYKLSLILSLLVLATPLWIYGASNLQDYLEPIKVETSQTSHPSSTEKAKYEGAETPEGYRDKQLVVRGFITILYGLGWWIVGGLLSWIFAGIGLRRKERGRIKIWAISTAALTFILTILMAFYLASLFLSSPYFNSHRGF